LNECVDAAKGKYLARMDSDDVAYPLRLEKQVQFLETHPDIDLLSTFVLVFGVDGVVFGKRAGPIRHEDIVRQPLRSFPMIHPTWTGKLSWFRTHRYRKEAVRCEDHDLLLRSLLESRYAVLPEILLGYREERLELRKILRSRMNWVRSVGGHVSGFWGPLQLVYVAIDQASKACVDSVAALTGLNYKLLRHRARPAEAAEIQEWEEVWKLVRDKPSVKAVEQMT
jgi:glycosyltransferase involved in cell wall biosynthesis